MDKPKLPDNTVILTNASVDLKNTNTGNVALDAFNTVVNSTKSLFKYKDPSREVEANVDLSTKEIQNWILRITVIVGLFILAVHAIDNAAAIITAIKH